ncbi:FAD-dependent monooxygenase [Nocardiopsis sp. N85]|uniref:FAD-dependent monooxygenase n=1 Tax=Nocardiopsis sp. N85 TaxID=3029400 RepID=UPI00237FC1E8|nr:FAD-dependent monooxygenase [Nocardiopsis sp. N85]MDE3721926.1 FAD-dependent monooxygenase [Nocardiopsis sp. N85]
MSTSSDVLVIGAGPAGMTLACDLLRRGVAVRIVSASSEGFQGSRAKGVQPRTQEVFDDLGVLDALGARSTTYPRLGVHLGPLTLRRTMIPLHEATEAVPHADTLLIGQYDTDAALRRRIAELGGEVEFGTRLTDLEPSADGVRATLEGPDGTTSAHAGYLIGADGGASTVRTLLGIPFDGTTDESDRMIVADLVLDGLSRDLWHVWPGLGGRFMALCPMPGGEVFQLMLKLRAGEEADVTTDGLTAKIRSFSGARSVTVSRVRWSSVWRPNTRLARRYREGRILLVGDAAHVHPPTGAQGLNTGVQDAYNLGWKLGQTLAGAPDSLLDTYEDERQPVAARVLGLASEIYASTRNRPTAAMTRGDEERQLSLGYRGGPLAPSVAEDATGVRPGDRAPNIDWTDPESGPQRLIDHLRGPHFTLLALGEEAIVSAADLPWPRSGAPLRTVALPSSEAARAARAYGTRTPAHILIRPDGYVAYTANGRWAESAARFGALALPA